MKRLNPPTARAETSKSKPARIEEHPETKALLRNLDRLYERLRKRAEAEWLRSHAEEDPSDACVSVRITCGTGEKFTVSGKSSSGGS